MESILTNNRLVRTFTVRLPEQLAEGDEPPEPAESVVRTVIAHDCIGWLGLFPIEALNVFPGKSVKRGDDLCHLAYHTQLYIRGRAFEDELTPVLSLGTGDKKDWRISAEFGLEEGQYTRDDLTVHYVDNHVDTHTQTFAFYLPLDNEVVNNSVDGEGRRFRHWRFKPGQRVHLTIPVEETFQQIKLPREAVTKDGAETVVFRKYIPPPADDPNAHVHHSYIEFERVPVQVRYEKSDAVVLRTGDQLKPDDVVAMNNAYKLLLALKRKGGSGGHHHGHSH